MHRNFLTEWNFLIQSQVGEFFYGYGDHNTLQEVTVELLKESGLTIASAESLTGGLFAASVVAFQGAPPISKGEQLLINEKRKKRN